MKLTEVFEGLGTQMLADLDYIQSQIKHHGERGGQAEAVLREFLRQYLPSCYGVSRGEIVDTVGRTSRQCDLVIYDSSKCPLLVAGQDYQVFPVEPVVAVGEVKSVLTRVELKDAVNKIASVKRLRRGSSPEFPVKRTA